MSVLDISVFNANQRKAEELSGAVPTSSTVTRVYALLNKLLPLTAALSEQEWITLYNSVENDPDVKRLKIRFIGGAVLLNTADEKYGLAGFLNALEKGITAIDIATYVTCCSDAGDEGAMEFLTGLIKPSFYNDVVHPLTAYFTARDSLAANPSPYTEDNTPWHPQTSFLLANYWNLLIKDRKVFRTSLNLPNIDQKTYAESLVEIANYNRRTGIENYTPGATYVEGKRYLLNGIFGKCEWDTLLGAESPAEQRCVRDYAGNQGCFNWSPEYGGFNSTTDIAFKDAVSAWRRNGISEDFLGTDTLTTKIFRSSCLGAKHDSVIICLLNELSGSDLSFSPEFWKGLNALFVEVPDNTFTTKYVDYWTTAVHSQLTLIPPTTYPGRLTLSDSDGVPLDEDLLLDPDLLNTLNARLFNPRLGDMALLHGMFQRVLLYPEYTLHKMELARTYRYGDAEEFDVDVALQNPTLMKHLKYIIGRWNADSSVWKIVTPFGVTLGINTDMSLSTIIDAVQVNTPRRCLVSAIKGRIFVNQFIASSPPTSPDRMFVYLPRTDLYVQSNKVEITLRLDVYDAATLLEFSLDLNRR